MKRFQCVCGESCRDYGKCKKTRMVIRPCGRSNPKLGDLSSKLKSTTITKYQKRICSKYTSIKRVCGLHRVAFTVGVQTFNIADGTREHCRIMRKFFSVALSKLIESEQKGNITHER